MEAHLRDEESTRRRAQLLHGAEKRTDLLKFRVAVAEIPANNDARLAAAYDAPRVELELEHPGCVGRVCRRRDVRVLVRVLRACCVRRRSTCRCVELGVGLVCCGGGGCGSGSGCC